MRSPAGGLRQQRKAPCHYFVTSLSRFAGEGRGEGKPLSGDVRNLRAVDGVGRAVEVQVVLVVAVE